MEGERSHRMWARPKYLEAFHVLTRLVVSAGLLIQAEVLMPRFWVFAVENISTNLEHLLWSVDQRALLGKVYRLPVNKMISISLIKRCPSSCRQIIRILASLVMTQFTGIDGTWPRFVQIPRSSPYFRKRLSRQAKTRGLNVATALFEGCGHSRLNITPN